MEKVTLVNLADENEQYILSKDRNVVGRFKGGKNDVNIPLKYKRVSRKHCEIYWKKGVLMVKDTNSTHGTYIDGKRINEEETLRDGDELGLGLKYVLEVIIGKKELDVKKKDLKSPLDSSVELKIDA